MPTRELNPEPLLYETSALIIEQWELVWLDRHQIWSWAVHNPTSASIQIPINSHCCVCHFSQFNNNSMHFNISDSSWWRYKFKKNVNPFFTLFSCFLYPFTFLLLLLFSLIYFFFIESHDIVDNHLVIGIWWIYSVTILRLVMP